MKKLLIIFVICILTDGAHADVKKITGERPKRIVLITIDTLRADHLGFMGYPRNTSPFLDRLAKESVVFRKAYAVIPLTTPSHASIFTSLYPIQHRVLGNENAIDPALATMAEYLKENGYETVAFVSASFLSRNMGRGFDHFDAPALVKPSDPKAIDAPQLLQHNSPHDPPPLSTPPPILPLDIMIEEERARHGKRPADETIEKARAWLAGKSGAGKIFLWIHLYDPHLPFVKDHGYKEGSGDKSKEEMIRFWTEQQGVELDFYKEDRKENLRDTMNKYDGEIQFLDSQLGNLYDFMENSGFNKDSLWIITSDHGEGLGSHSYYGHDERVYNEQLSAPIIFHNPNYRKSLTINSLVENIDILPTVAEIVEFSLRTSPMPAEGKSLLPLISGKKAVSDKYVFSMLNEIDMEHCRKRVVFVNKLLPIDPDACRISGRQFSLQNENFKLIHTAKAGSEFYNLKADPNERNNLIADDSNQMKKMQKRLLDIIKRVEEGQTVNFTPRKDNAKDRDLHEESLKSLGY